MSARTVRLAEVTRHVVDSLVPDHDDAMPYVALEHLAQGEPQLLGHARASSARSAKSRFETNDVLLGRLRPALRKAALAPFDGVCSTDILVLRASEVIAPRYLLAVVHREGFWRHACATAVGTRMPRTRWKSLGDFRFALPSLDEQARLVEVLTALDGASLAAEAHLAQLRETRRALGGAHSVSAIDEAVVRIQGLR